MDPYIAATLGGAAGQAGSNLMNWGWQGITTGNWGGTSKERKNVITDTRKLRKTAYQDMVYSLTEAGLNPILAVGASPGAHSAQAVPQYGQQGNPGFMGAAVSAKEAALEEERNPAEIDLKRKNADLAAQQRITSQLGIPSLLQQYDINQATIDRIRAETGRIRGETANLGLMGAVYEMDAKMKGASARELDERTRQYQSLGLPGGQPTWEKILWQALNGNKDLGATGNSAGGFQERFNAFRNWFNEQGKDIPKQGK